MPDATEYLFQLEQALRQRGLPKLEPGVLKETHRRLSAPNVLQWLDGGQLTVEQLADQTMQAVQTIQQRRQGLPPNGGSRIAGAPPILGAEADPRDALFRSSVPMGQTVGPVGVPQGQGVRGMNPVMQQDQPFERMPLVRLEGGGTIRKPTFAIIGERGPEMALLQRGSVVLPSHASMQAMGQVASPLPGQMPPTGLGSQVSSYAQSADRPQGGVNDFVRSLLLSRMAPARPMTPPAPPSPPSLPAAPTLPAQANPQAALALARRRRLLQQQRGY